MDIYLGKPQKCSSDKSNNQIRTLIVGFPSRRAEVKKLNSFSVTTDWVTATSNFL